MQRCKHGTCPGPAQDVSESCQHAIRALLSFLLQRALLIEQMVSRTVLWASTTLLRHFYGWDIRMHHTVAYLCWSLEHRSNCLGPSAGRGTAASTPAEVCLNPV